MTDQKLKSLGFKEADGTVHPRVIISAAAREKHGKTNFGLTAPGPIALFNSDIGLEGVVHKFLNQKKVLVYTFGIPSDKAAATKEWNNMETAWKACLLNPEIRTVVADTATDLWDLKRMAAFGKLTQIMPFMYSTPNAEFKTFLKLAYGASTTNVILLHKMGKKYVNEIWHGDYERKGFSNLGYEVQINAELYRDEDNTFHIKIIDCRQNHHIAGDDYCDLEDIKMVNFPFIAQMALSETSAEDWE